MNDTINASAQAIASSSINPDAIVLGFGAIALVIFIGLLVWAINR